MDGKKMKELNIVL